jgi:hypothetical protein
MSNEQKPDDDTLRELLGKIDSDDPVIRAQMNDQRLSKLAEYDATEGFMKDKVSGEVIQARFTHLKNRVKKESFTLKQLEDDVYGRWGVSEGPRDSKAKAEHNHIQGFSPDSIECANIDIDSPENH